MIKPATTEIGLKQDEINNRFYLLNNDDKDRINKLIPVEEVDDSNVDELLEEFDKIIFDNIDVTYKELQALDNKKEKVRK